MGPIAFSIPRIPPGWRKKSPCTRNEAWDLAAKWCDKHGFLGVLTVRSWDREKEPVPRAVTVPDRCWIARCWRLLGSG